MACVKLVILVVVIGICGQVCAMPLDAKAHYCSKNLSDAVSLVCQNHGGYFEPFSGDNLGGRESQGIVEECCKNACSVRQMTLYCKDSMPSSEPSFARRLYNIVAAADDPALLTNRLTIRE